MVNSAEADFEHILRTWSAGKLLVVGKSISRLDAWDKVLGTAKYVEDFIQSNALFARIIKSPISHGIIKQIDYSDIKNDSNFVDVVTDADIPGDKFFGIFAPEFPIFAYNNIVKFHAEPLGLIVAKSLIAADMFRDKIKIEYEEQKGVYDLLDAIKPDAPKVHPERASNIAYEVHRKKGDTEVGFRTSDIVVEQSFRIGTSYPAYIEPEAALVVPYNGKVSVIVGAQTPHVVQRFISRALRLPESKVEVIVPYIGGSFGPKTDIGPIVATQAAVAAYKIKKPVFLLYSRDDSIQVMPKRVDAYVKYRIGATYDGKLQALEATFYYNTGAYAVRSSTLILRPAIHATGPYSVPNASVDAYFVFTNTVPRSAFRGYGNPEIQFGLEVTLDMLAEKIGIDPLELRLKNALKTGDVLLDGSVYDDTIGVDKMLKEIRAISNWDIKRKEYKEYNLTQRYSAKGIGVACGWHGVAHELSQGYVTIRKDGSVDVYTGITEVGQGTKTGIAQVVAEIFGININLVNVHISSADAPETGGTYGSRGSNLGAMGVYLAAMKLKEKLDDIASSLLYCAKSDLEYKNNIIYCLKNNKFVDWSTLVIEAYNRNIGLSAAASFTIPGMGSYAKGGKIYPTYSSVCMVVETDIDLETGQVKVTRIWPAIDAGRIINPALATQQIHGSIIMGIGVTLHEEIVFDDKGRIKTTSFMDYLVPTTMEIVDTAIEPPIFIELPSKYGPYGAKGLGEAPMIPVAPAIANAIHFATGRLVNFIPITSEKLYNLLRQQGI
jgi:CO/xanthine dehydrogenase Mo-binding subunit